MQIARIALEILKYIKMKLSGQMFDLDHRIKLIMTSAFQKSNTFDKSISNRL